MEHEIIQRLIALHDREVEYFNNWYPKQALALQHNKRSAAWRNHVRAVDNCLTTIMTCAYVLGLPMSQIYMTSIERAALAAQQESN